MNARVVSLLGVVVAVSVALVGARGIIPTRLAPPAAPADVETARIQRHLARVEQELQSKDVSFLTPAQLCDRREQIRRLHEYWVAGRFPHNHDFPGRRVPYFVDRHGTQCAITYLITASGGRGFVDQVARSANNAKVLDLAASPTFGPALTSWLERAGLTVQEAQRIQPEYDYSPPSEDSEISPAYGIASGAVGALNLVSVVVNGFVMRTSDQGRWIPLTGLATGAAGVTLGIAKVDEGHPVKTLGVTNIVIGASSVVASFWALSGSPEPKSATVGASTPRLAITPTARLDGGMHPMMGLCATF